MTFDPGRIGSEIKDPLDRRRAQARELARRTMPYIKESLHSVKSGKVTWDKERVEMAFEALNQLAPLIDEEEDIDERDSLMIHGGLSFVLRSREAGQMDDRRLGMVFALADTFVELYVQAAEILKLEVDRSGE